MVIFWIQNIKKLICGVTFFFELILGEMSDVKGISFHSLVPKPEKDSLYNSRSELLT